MYRLMVDTNVLLDLISEERPAYPAARALFAEALCHDGCELYALASSLKDVYFIYARKYSSESMARKNIRLLGRTLALCDCDGELVRLALDSDEPDFEDGLVRCAAERARLDGIVTRDKSGFLGSSVPKLTIDQARELISQK